MSAQEYELIKEDDEKSLRKYRKQCMQEMHEHLSFGPKFETVYDLDSGEAFLEVIEKEHRLTVVVVHIYKDGVKGCDALNSCMDCLASEYTSVKFCRIRAAATGAGERFSDDVLPTLLVYKAGELLGNFLAVTQHFNEEFFATDVEAFLNEYGLLPVKECGAGAEEDEADVEWWKMAESKNGWNEWEESDKNKFHYSSVNMMRCIRLHTQLNVKISLSTVEKTINVLYSFKSNMNGIKSRKIMT